MNWAQFRRMLRSWLAHLNTIASPSQVSTSPQATAAQPAVAVLAQIVSSILSGLIASWIAQDILRYNFSFAVVLSFVLFFVFSMILQTRWLPLRLNVFYILVILLTIIMVQSIVVAALYVSTRPPTVYLILDATEKSKTVWGDLLRSVNMASQVQSDKTVSGIRIYGGNISSNTECDNTKEVIEPMSALNYKSKLSNVLANLSPGGNASLTIAVLDAVRDDLKQYRGPIKLIVLTSGIDPKCEPGSGGILENVAADIRKNTRDDVTIAIIGIGELPETEQSVLKKYAEAFNGVYLGTSGPTDLSTLITAPPSYFSNYFEPTPTP